jgi:hypothetical protein
VRQHGHAVVQARQQHVEQAADPGPVGRRPEQVAGLGEQLLRHLHARQVAEQDAVRVQRALRAAGGAGGVDDHRRVVRAGRDAGVAVLRARHLRIQVDYAWSAARRQHAAQRRQAVADRHQFRHACRIGDQRRSAAIG